MQQAEFVQDKIEEGFSSQQQFKPQQIVYTESLKQKPETLHKEEIKFKIPPAQEIKDKHYSLRPDLATGWQPKIQLPSPIPIIFQNPKYDNLIKRLLKKHSPKAKLCYLGPKYQNTYYAWYNKPFTFPYNHIKTPHNIKFSQRQFCGQHWQAEQEVHFDSLFQSGNLDSAIKVGQFQYDLFMRVDSNTRGHLQWFNFKVKNLHKDQEYTFNLCNFQKKKILYGRGLRPYVFSAQRFKNQKVGWQQRGENVTYEKKVGKTFKYLGIEQSKYCKLSFTLSTPYQNDQLQLAYCIPYTYTQMSQYLHKKLKQLESTFYVIIQRIQQLCTSLGGLEVPLLIIHENHKEKTQSTTADEEMTRIKRCVVVCGRAHPGESNGSFMMEGFLDFITGESKMAEFLRKHVIFKIVPMLNPDGVALGNYRTGLSGRDFNRQYKEPEKQVFPQVFAFKKLVTENKFIFKQNLSIFLDFHGHSVKKNTFAYGPQFPIVNKFYYESRIIPKIIGNLTPMFRYYSCSFKVAECKNTTARAVLLKKLNIPLAYTIQTSNGFYFDYEKLKDVAYTDAKWKLMGWNVGQAVFHYMELIVKADLLRHQKHKGKKVVKKDMIIRKTGRSVSNQKSPHSSKQLAQSQPCIILEGIQDQNIKHLFQEIKRAQEQKQKMQQQCSDDQMSEGSSDGEGQADDLSAKQFNKLMSCIRNKKFKNLDKCRVSPVKRTKTSQIESDEAEDQDKEKGDLGKQVDNRSSQIIIHKSRSHKADTKKEFLFNLIQAKKRSSTPKVINFSFALHSTPQKSKQKPQPSNILPTKINFFQPSYKHDYQPNKLTDIVMRKTFNSVQKQIINQRERQKNINIFTTTSYLAKSPGSNKEDGIQPVVVANRRNTRFDIHRMKKVVVDNIGPPV